MELPKDYLARFRIFYPTLLFEPAWKMLKEYRCPICGNLLKYPLGRKIAICRGKRHKKPFIINKVLLIKLATKK